MPPSRPSPARPSSTAWSRDATGRGRDRAGVRRTCSCGGTILSSRGLPVRAAPVTFTSVSRGLPRRATTARRRRRGVPALGCHGAASAGHGRSDGVPRRCSRLGADTALGVAPMRMCSSGRTDSGCRRRRARCSMSPGVQRSTDFEIRRGSLAPGPGDPRRCPATTFTTGASLRPSGVRRLETLAGLGRADGVVQRRADSSSISSTRSASAGLPDPAGSIRSSCSTAEVVHIDVAGRTRASASSPATHGGTAAISSIRADMSRDRACR